MIEREGLNARQQNSDDVNTRYCGHGMDIMDRDIDTTGRDMGVYGQGYGRAGRDGHVHDGYSGHTVDKVGMLAVASAWYTLAPQRAGVYNQASSAAYLYNYICLLPKPY